jgi:hypothetical protein
MQIQRAHAHIRNVIPLAIDDRLRAEQLHDKFVDAGINQMRRHERGYLQDAKRDGVGALMFIVAFLSSLSAPWWILIPLSLPTIAAVVGFYKSIQAAHQCHVRVKRLQKQYIVIDV